MVFLCWLIFWSGADIMYRKVHACFKLVHSLFVKLGLIVKREEEEWDEEDYLQRELPNALADDIREAGGVNKAQIFTESSKS
jgi:hypothetical protein